MRLNFNIKVLKLPRKILSSDTQPLLYAFGYLFLGCNLS